MLRASGLTARFVQLLERGGILSECKPVGRTSARHRGCGDFGAVGLGAADSLLRAEVLVAQQPYYDEGNIGALMIRIGFFFVFFFFWGGGLIV